MISYPSPKINIGLNVLRRRADGYHDIDTLFYPVYAYHDTLEIVPSDAFSIDVRLAEGELPVDWDPQNDLCAKAYRLMRDRYGIAPVSIRLLKSIPVGAGLGGGSSDCAATIKMLDEIFCLHLPTSELESLAGSLGADCAFFIKNIPQWGSGKGEILTPADIDLSDYEIRITVLEGESVSTREAYAGIVPGEPEMNLRNALARPVTEWKHMVKNDFETSVFPSHPRIAEAKERLYRDGAIYASMTGSGSAVFGIFGK